MLFLSAKAMTYLHTENVSTLRTLVADHQCPHVPDRLSLSLSSSLMLHNQLISSHHSSTLWHSSSTTATLSGGQKAISSSLREACRHSLQPGTCRAAFTIQFSTWVETVALSGTAAPSSAAESGTLPPYLKLLRLIWIQIMTSYLHPPEQAAVCWLCSRHGLHIGLSLASTKRPLDHL